MVNKKFLIHIPKNAGICFSSNKNLELKSKVQTIQKTHIDKIYLKELESTFPKSPNYCHTRYLNLNKSSIKNYSLFCVIRNPWDRVLSRYFYGLKIGAFEKNTSFDDFLDFRFKYAQKNFYWHRAVDSWYLQLDYITNEKREIICDVLRYEKLNEDVNDYFNSNIKMKVANSSDRKDNYLKFYNKKQIEIVSDWYREDIEKFGFYFDTGATKNYWKK